MKQLSKRRRGNVVKFDARRRRKLVECVAAGVPFHHACAAVGVSYSRFCEVRNENPKFANQIEKAVADAIESRLRIIQDAADAGDVRAAQWYLERVHPQHFARNRIELTGADGGPLAAGVVVLQWPHEQNGGTIDVPNHRLAETSSDAD